MSWGAADRPMCWWFRWMDVRPLSALLRSHVLPSSWFEPDFCILDSHKRVLRGWQVGWPLLFVCLVLTTWACEPHGALSLNSKHETGTSGTLCAACCTLCAVLCIVCVCMCVRARAHASSRLLGGGGSSAAATAVDGGTHAVAVSNSNIITHQKGRGVIVQTVQLSVADRAFPRPPDPCSMQCICY